MGASVGVGGALGQGQAQSGDVAGSRRRPAALRAVGRWLTRALLVAVLFVVAGAVGLGLYASAHADRIYAGVSVAGVPVGGLTPGEARAAVERRWAEYAGAPLALVAEGETFAVTPAEAGARLEAEATIAAAFAYGREGSVWARSQRWARGLIGEVALPPWVSVDQGAAEARLRAIAPAIVRAPQDARVAMEAEGGPTLVADEPGVSLDLAAAKAALLARIAAVEGGPVAIATLSRPAAVRAGDLAGKVAAARAAVDAPLVLAAAEGVWHVAEADLKGIVSVDAATAELRVAREPLVELVRGLAAGVDRPAVDAGLAVGEDGRLAVVPGVEAAEVEVGRTVAAIEGALLGGGDRVELAVARAEPAITDRMAAAEAERGEGLIGRGMALGWTGGKGELTRDELLRALTIEARPGEAEPFVFGLDRGVVGELLTPQAEAFDRAATDARFRIGAGGGIEAVAEAKPGRRLDVEDGVGAVLAAFGEPEPKAKPGARIEVAAVAPKWTAADAENIALGGAVLAEASTPYANSSEPRRRNVERAVELQHAWLVPPDGVFSYVENIGAIDAEHGFVTGFGIIADEGQITTAPVIGGGICQVSTTIFQAAFWAGLGIEERYQHPYYLRSYGEAPRGLPGLDAMVNVEADWALDFKFRNTTANWLAVLVLADGQNVTTKIVGTDPGWEVRASAPAVTNLVPKETAMRYTDSPELPAGQELLVESAEDGFDVTVERQVLKGGKVIDEYAVSSSFAPARNLTLRGTGVAQ